jgi:hypothetical protein
MMSAIATTRSRSPGALSAPEENISPTASTSFVTRVTSLPSGVRSKKPSGLSCKTSNTRRRSRAIPRAPASWSQ